MGDCFFAVGEGSEGVGEGREGEGLACCCGEGVGSGKVLDRISVWVSIAPYWIPGRPASGSADLTSV